MAAIQKMIRLLKKAKIWVQINNIIPIAIPKHDKRTRNIFFSIISKHPPIAPTSAPTTTDSPIPPRLKFEGVSVTRAMPAVTARPARPKIRIPEIVPAIKPLSV